MMMKRDCDLLTQPMLHGRGRDRVPRALTLPGLLAALARDEVVDFSRARAHQQHPWSMFLTQLAAIAMRRAKVDTLPTEEGSWRSMLLDLTSGEPEPWCLIVEDLAKPAFFQPPVPEGELRKPSKKGKPGEQWDTLETPDDLDVLVTSKRHDVKSGLVAPDDIEAWIYALCCLQTTQGFPGRGYTRVARMKGGFGNRPRVGVSPGLGFGQRFRRDVPILLQTWPDLVTRGFRDAGIGLAWLPPWDGASSLDISSLTPHFVEVCWRVRLERAERGICARSTTTSKRRCAPEVDTGDVGDPWIPTSRVDGSILTPGSAGYHYKLLVELLFEQGYEAAATQVLRGNDPDPVFFWASALVRGKGKTEGLHEMILPLSGPARLSFLTKSTRDAVGRRAEERVKQAESMRSQVLYPAWRLLDPAPPDALNSRIDERFFASLFATLKLSDEQARAVWEDELLTLAEAELEAAIERAPLPDARFYRATVAARRMFYGCLKKRFPDAFERRLARDESPTEEIPA
jgi:CRISPR system Cascade subunit CasA